jgi:primary-amine oxidase
MQGAYVVINQNATNKYGNARGYAVHPGPLCRLTNLDSKRTERNVEWAKSHLSVTKRKENEGRSSSAWNMNLPGKPSVDFGRVRLSLGLRKSQKTELSDQQYIDDESIEQEDLVVWLNLGTHHIPRAEGAR